MPGNREMSAPTDHGLFEAGHWHANGAIMTTIAVALRGLLVTTIAVAAIAFLLLTHSHI